MPIEQSLLGRSYPATAPYTVSREKIREFADAIGDADPAYREPDAARALGYPDVIAPPTFAILLTLSASQQIIDDPELRIDYSRVVHGDQKFVAARPVRAGDTLVTEVSIDALKSLAGNDIITSRGDVRTEDGEHVVTAYSTLVVRAGGEP
ncbi:MAG: FAS1-like dehydratase domain-containing protein [Mycobacteriales bacterium]